MGLLLRYNIRNLFVRRISTAMTVLGIAMVVAVYIVLMALAEGLRHVGEVTGDPLSAIVIQSGTNAETASSIGDTVADRLEDLPAIPRSEAGPAVSRELYIVLCLPRPGGGPPANVVARGVSDRAFDLRPEVRVDGNRRPKGSDIVVSRTIAGRFANLKVGDRIHFGRRDWNVVAHFDAGGAAWDSEIWVDFRELGVDFKRENAPSSLAFRLNRPEDLGTLRSAMAGSKELSGVKVLTMRDYFAEQTKSSGALVAIALVITVMLSCGAGLGAMNTMYAAVGNRSREIGTLRALGFSRAVILFSFVFESALIGALGGAAGGVIALPANGITTGTLNWVSFAETAFKFRITPGMLAGGILVGAVVGAVGGLLPAINAARRPILEALRA